MMKEAILNEVRMGVLGMMEDTILGGGNSFHYEQQVGTAWIDVEFHEVRIGGFLEGDYDITVSHEDGHRNSPTLERELISVMPDWFKTKEALMPTA